MLYKNKILYLTILMFCLITIIPFISAQPPVSQIQQFEEGFVIEGSPTTYIKQNTDYDFNFFLYNISNGRNAGGATVSCLFYLADNQGSLVFSGNPTFANGYYSIMIDGANFSEVGHYPYGVNCNSSRLGGAMVNYFEVTPSGKVNSITKVLAYITLLLFLMSLILLFNYSTRNINYEQWHNSIVKKYENKNIVRVIISSIGYNMMKNSFIWYYLFGLPIILLITDITYVFGIESMVYVMQIVLGIYYFGFLIVAIFFFGYIQEWFAYIVDEIKSLDYGV